MKKNGLKRHLRGIFYLVHGTLHRYVEIDSAKYDGKPMIKGTRVPVQALVMHYRSGMALEDILSGFPNLTSAQLFDALRYYFDNKTAIDAELE